MKKRVIILICCLVVVIGIVLIGVFGTKNQAEDGVTRCLLIGCDQFVSMPGTEPASGNNVNTMAALLKDFMPEGTRTFLQMNGPGTVAEFEQLVEDAFGDAKKAERLAEKYGEEPILGVDWNKDGKLDWKDAAVDEAVIREGKAKLFGEDGGPKDA
ncbi:MAG: hypothetical protein J6X24_05680 [Firmicutes bacterium]|nr:hypothetical protein [Bacillota bacterium]